MMPEPAPKRVAPGDAMARQRMKSDDISAVDDADAVGDPAPLMDVRHVRRFEQAHGLCAAEDFTDRRAESAQIVPRLPPRAIPCEVFVDRERVEAKNERQD